MVLTVIVIPLILIKGVICSLDTVFSVKNLKASDKDSLDKTEPNKASYPENINPNEVENSFEDTFFHREGTKEDKSVFEHTTFQTRSSTKDKGSSFEETAFQKKGVQKQKGSLFEHTTFRTRSSKKEGDGAGRR